MLPNALYPPKAHETALPKIAVAGLGARIVELGRGDRLTLIGIGCNGVGDVLRADVVGSRSALLLESAGGGTAEKILDHLLDDLADLALDR